MSRLVRSLVFIVLLTAAALYIALPRTIPIRFNWAGLNVDRELHIPDLRFQLGDKTVEKQFRLKMGLDIQGGMQVVLSADMSGIPEADRQAALESAREVVSRRVDLFGIAEPSIITSRVGNEYRLLVDLPGIEDPNQALQLLGTTAQLDFRLQNKEQPPVDATESATMFLNQFSPTGLTGKELKRAIVQFDQNTAEPTIALEFNEEGRDLFADITQNNVDQVLAIFLDEFPVALPRINSPILDGKAVISGGFTLDEAKQLAIQLNAGALPMPISVIEQRNLGASLGQDSVQQSVRAGLVGVGLVMLFMILIYGWSGVIANMALVIYGILTVAIFKTLGVTLTLPGIAGMLLSIGMAVDANILIFERMKEELRLDRPFARAMELGFGRAWDSIKDANIATIMTALVLINPLNLSFLNTSGLVRGFGITLLIGVVTSLFTGVVITRTLMRVFLRDPKGDAV